MAIEKTPQILAKACLKQYAKTLKHYPVETQRQRLRSLARWAWLQPIEAEVERELFPPEPSFVLDATAIAIKLPLPAAAGVHAFDSTYRRYHCLQENPLSCNNPQPTLQEGQRMKYCQACGFPTLLPEQAEIRGQRGTYRIDRWIGRRGMGRLYAATQLGTNQPVVIKDYLLPQRHFNPEEIYLQKQTFKNLAGIGLADGRVQDFRSLEPLEAIADEREERCYLVLDERNVCPTLNHYLTQGSLSETQVRMVLNQVLQTLEFLHGQKFRLPAGQMQAGIVHGNLSLDSLLLLRGQQESYEFVKMQNLAPVTEPANSTTHVRQEHLDFFIYASDLALWERLFEPPLIKSSFGSTVGEDLLALGYVAFYLLAGKVVTSSGQPLDPKNDRHWAAVEPSLKEFILRLLGLETPFETAQAARRELLRLPQVAIAPPPEERVEPAKEPAKKISRSSILLLSVIGLGVLGWLAWFLLPKPQASIASQNAPQICCLPEVGGIPVGKFTYTATEDGIWRYVLTQHDLLQKGQTLEQRLKAAQPKLQINYDPATSTEAAIAKVRSRQAAFAIVPLLQPLPDDLESQAIAYDGLAVFVAFSYAKRENSLPVQLKGKMTLEQLRQLYTRQVSSQKELGNSALPVNLYVPADREAMEVFEQRVLKNAHLNLSDRSLWAKQSDVSKMLRQTIEDFESQQAWGIGFSPLSKVVGQCSVYPLALQTESGNPVQALVLSNGQAIDPTTDLCDRKGSYHPSVELFRTGRYPLAYPIAVIYPRDNDLPPIGEKLAEILKTREGQRLLRQTGLVPLNP